MISMYKYKFSVVIAVYNVAPFLEEAVQSLVVQDIDFQKNIQVILVDDGSTDGSDVVCDKLQEQYPDNIVVVHKENGGVSSARNEGLRHTEGEYVNFLDGDDKLSAETFSSVYKHFKEWNDVELVTIPLIFFEGQTGQHILNNKFEAGSRVIDVLEEYDYPLLSLSASFVTAEAAKKIRFDENLVTAEDAKVIMQILLQSPRYGVVKEATYWYRRRASGQSSAIQSSVHTREWYVNYIKYFALWSMDESRAIYGAVPYFVQYIIMYELQWRYSMETLPEEVLSPEEIAEYRASLKKILYYIADSVILAQKHIFTEHKLFILHEKYGKDLQRVTTGDDIEYRSGDQLICRLSENRTKIDFIEINNNQLYLEGFSMFYGFAPQEKVKWFLKVNGKLLPCETVERKEITWSLGQPIAIGMGFKICVDLLPGEQYELVIVSKVDDSYIERTNIAFGKFSPLQAVMWNSYYTVDKYLLTYDYHKLLIQPYTRLLYMKREMSYLKGLLKENSPAAKKAFILRSVYAVRKLFPMKETWIITDRTDKADDNGEMFFRYMQEHPDKNVQCYYAISADCEDYSRMQQYGQVIPFGGWRYKWLYICGAKIVSSQGEDYVYRPLNQGTVYYSDLIQKSRFIFLQHGVIKDDLSRWLNKYAKNIHMFVTSTKPEWQSVLDYDYYYDKDVVRLTGLPRHDYLYHDEKKYITIIPTWRSYLVGEIDMLTGKRMTKPGFKESQYYKMYAELLNNKELLQTLGERGYKLRFLSHPNMAETLKEFDIYPEVELIPASEPYRKIFAETSLLITDYSSVAFDFAYLRKPILYYQVDKEEFFSGAHTYDKGYFEYETDGFGEVVYTADAMAELIMEYVDNDCSLKELYLDRINATYSFSDKDNCKRVYEAIKQVK